jgi:predicted ATPase
MIRRSGLSRIELSNFKAFRSQGIDLSALTLFSGLNGSGKSTVLQALAMLKQSFDTGSLQAGRWLLNGELVELGSGSDVLHDNPVEGNIINIGLAAKGELNEIVTSTWPVRYDPKADVLRAITEQFVSAASVESFNLFSPGFQYLRADRLNPAATYAKSQYAVGTRRFLGSRGEYAAHFLLEYGDDPIGCPSLIEPNTAQADKLLSQTNAWMQRFSPDVRLDIENISRTDLVQLRYSYRTKGIGGGGGYFRATNVGFGLSYSLPVVVACLSSKPGDLVLVENPEAHLHPEGQLAISDLLARAASAGIQVVVETHSDHILNGIRLAVKRRVIQPELIAFRFFRRSGSGAAEIKCPTINHDGMLSEWPAGFFTQWDQAVVELLS